tara:strand:+ start:1338 stop:1721 length:384 start_codon:yes stop_codon:yes gene_type:complete
MLLGQVLNSQATLNNYIELGSLEFVPGEKFDLFIKIMNSQLDIRYVVENTNAIVKFIFNKSNNLTEEVTATFMANDRSIVSAEVSAAISAEILGGTFIMEIDVNGDGLDIKKVVAQGGLTKQIVGAC